MKRRVLLIHNTQPDPYAQQVVDHEAAYNRAAHWHDRDVSYWFRCLVEEVGELAESLNGEHEHPPETELVQIGSIAIGLLRQIDRLKGEVKTWQ